MSVTHTHGHETPSKEQALIYRGIYAKAWGLTFVIVALGVTGSILSGSLALLADVGHIITDSFLALVPLSVAHAIVIGKGHSRTPIIIGGIIASVLLLYIGTHVIIEAREVLAGGHEHHVDGWLLFGFSLAAAGVNFTQHRLLSRVGQMHRHAAHSGYHFHVLTDLVKNIALPLLGIGIATGLFPEVFDLYMAYIIGVVLILRSLLLLGEAIWGHETVTGRIDRAIKRLVE